MKITKSIFITATLALTACASVGPDYQAPTMAKVDVNIANNIKTAAYERQWWQRFNDDILNELVELTLGNNYSLAAAKANVASAMAQFTDVDNDNIPSGSFDAQVENRKAQKPGESLERVYEHRYQAGANLSWQLDLAGKLRRASESALANAETAHADFEALQVSLISNLVSRYADYKGLQNRIIVAERSVDNLQQTAQFIDIQVKEGMTTELELHRILAQQNNVRAIIIHDANELAKAKYDIAFIKWLSSQCTPRRFI